MSDNKALKLKLEKAFDILWDRIDNIMKTHNPCGHCVVDGNHSCFRKANQIQIAKTHNYYEVGLFENNEHFSRACCSYCKFWDKGCKANKPLLCRTFLCWELQSKGNSLNALIKPIID